MSINENIAKIKKELNNNSVLIVAVSKNIEPSKIKEAYEAGLSDFGESKIQEALPKMKALANTIGKYINWHFIGHIQTNKVKNVVGNFSLIHSVDSGHLLQAISKSAIQKELTQEVLLQVKYDEKKFGFTANELYNEFESLNSLPNVSIKGLMTMAPLVKNTNLWLDCFNNLKVLKDRLVNNYNINLKELSMGMSQDYLVAVSCGATIIRLGSAIFN